MYFRFSKAKIQKIIITCYMHVNEIFNFIITMYSLYVCILSKKSHDNVISTKILNLYVGKTIS